MGVGRAVPHRAHDSPTTRAVSQAVATGITSLERLGAESPDAMLADFADTEQALGAILG